MRIVFGLGTRAVDRSDDDYTRLVALNAPGKRPEVATDDLSQFAQRKVDVLALNANQLVDLEFPEVCRQSTRLQLERFATRDSRLERMARETGRKNIFPWVLNLDGVLDQTPFVDDMRQILNFLHKAYDYPVDIEFAANVLADGQYKINVLQCRPLQIQGGGMIVDPPEDLREDDVVLRAEGAIIGQSRLGHIDRLIYVVPSAYGQLPIRDRYAIARLVGRIAQLKKPGDPATVMLLGPGRWGTTTPSLGVSVSFGEINRVSIICEIVAMREDLVPDVSLGTHFFSDIVETGILYLALFPDRSGNRLNESFFLEAPNKLPDLLPKTPEAQTDVVRVIDVADLDGDLVLAINANTIKQQVVCYMERDDSSEEDEQEKSEAVAASKEADH
jgi:hypothetical protein